MGKVNDSTSSFEIELGQALSLPLPVDAGLIVTHIGNECEAVVDFNYSAGRLSLTKKAKWQYAPSIIRECWQSMRDMIASSPYYDKREGW